MEAGKTTGKEATEKIGSVTGRNAKESIGKERITKENIGVEGIAKEDIKKEIAEKETIEEEGAEKESKEIDIYLFSNGQMYSPPRKYHLRTDELMYWEATLNFLARLQYGSLHSAIELYELDGRKVEDPKYIRDCAVYVAVVPPDPFIYAGYDKYLVKASKSYEKRVSKRANGTELLDPDNANKDSVKLSKQDHDLMPAQIPAGNSEIRPQNLIFRKNEIRKSSLKSSSQKLIEKIKPVANQVSQQRPNVPRKPNLKSSTVAKRLYNSQKDTPRNNFNKNAQPNSDKISSINKSIIKSKSPVLPELLICDHSNSKVNESRQQFVNATPSSKIINTKTQGSINKVNTPTLRNTLKLINTNTKTNADTCNVTKDSTANEILKESDDHPKVSINRIKTSSVNNLPKPIKYDRPSAINNKTKTLRVDDKLHSSDKTLIPITNETKESTAEKILLPPASQLSILTNSRASTVKPISDLYSDESTPITGINNNNRTANVENRDKDRMCTTTENKISTIEEIPILENKDQVSGMYRLENSTEDRVPESISEVIIKLPVKNAATTKTKTAIVKKVTEPKDGEQIGILNKTSTSKVNETEFTTQLESNILIPKETPLSSNKELCVGIIKSAIQDLERNHPQIPLSHKITTSDQIPEANDKDCIPVIIKVSDTDKQNSPVLNKISYLPDPSIKTTDIDTIPVTNKIRVSKVDMIPTATVDVVVVKRDKEINKKRSSSDDLIETVAKQSIKDKSSSTQLNLYDIKVPMLNYVPERTIRYISNNDTEVIQNKDAINDHAKLSEKYVLGNSIDIIKKKKGPNSNKKHSFTFIVKNDYDNNNTKVTDMKIYPRDIQKTVNVPISNMITNKDFIHINIIRNPLNDTSLPIRDRPKTQPYNEIIDNSNTDFMQKNPDSHEITLKNKTSLHNLRNNSPENNQYSKIKETEMTTTFMNPKWEVNKVSAPSKDVISDNTESDTNQFIDLMQNGDIVNVKLSIQIRNADGTLKSTQTINMGKSNSVTKLDNGHIGKTPNELTRSKSLQSVENDSPSHLCCRKDKVIVYQCACCTQSGSENTNFTLPANPLNSGLHGFYVLLPVAMPVKNSAKPPSQTMDKQVQHTESFIKTNVTGSFKDTFITVPGDGDNQIKSSEKYDSPTKLQVAIMDEEIVHSQLIMMRTEPSQTSSRYKMDSKIQQTNTTTQNQSTQTDWCDVLLEARADPDGRYTFYLPPLHLLQQYSLR